MHLIEVKNRPDFLAKWYDYKSSFPDTELFVMVKII